MTPKLTKETMKEAVLSVTHDLRSPLLTVKEIVNRYAHVMSQKDLEAIVAATTRATDICEETLNEIGLKEKEETQNNFFIAIENIVKEFNGRNSELKTPVVIKSSLSQEVEVSINCNTLSRMVSNLLENSLRATKNCGAIEVILTNYNQKLFVAVKDNGYGIPQYQLEKLGGYGVTFSKDGHGFALWNINKTLEKLGGEVIIDSIEGVGTQVTLEIPLVVTEEKTLNLSQYKNFVLIDDDSLIHELIDFCLDSIGFNGHRYYLKNKEEFERHMNQLDSPSIKETCFVVDGHLGRNNPVGLRLIRGYNIANQSVLFTGDENIKSMGSEHVRVRCKSVSPFDFLKLA